MRKGSEGEGRGQKQRPSSSKMFRQMFSKTYIKASLKVGDPGLPEPDGPGVVHRDQTVVGHAADTKNLEKQNYEGFPF